ncbi:putative leucine-rich repeat receptor-like serine/threonine-protein kinase At2g14440 [Quercus suber]|uniref:Leucine-rich repeat receptor-like serine/threonine-protein kinase n=1 Tax=Quercus suber TaxID=58331 RepID=A0AAW0M8N3_QUESU|nr:putative leucine-rich repeat receptor-like serine/threonine-protein kinase At2g14440 [Quercus suber]POE64604.1 putative leucine-rich repeat receptor-like serine/threonine-protein kinase [Quercus suber]
MSFLSLLLLLLFSFLPLSLSQQQPPPPKGVLINCGATENSIIDDREWLADTGFVSGGTPKNLKIPVTVPTLATVRSFPRHLHTKYCFVVDVFRSAKYVIRTTYFYGGVNDGQGSPPVFDQMVDGTFWNVVNTTVDYANNAASYYEGVFVAQGKTMSLCIGSNKYTDSDPFISALEFLIVGKSLYNTTDFGNFGLSLVARNSFGYSGPIIRYPDDQFNRFWEPSRDNDSTVSENRNISVSGFWNVPPLKVFEAALTTTKVQPLVLNWPPASLSNSMYYIALYFADDRNSSSRVFNISINDVPYYRTLNVTPAGACVFATRWPLRGPTKITLTPAVGSDIGPLINAGEIFEVLDLGGRTATRDVIGLSRVKDSLKNPPLVWNGDPCMPRQYSWSGITCSYGPRIRVISLNLTSMGLSGSLSPSIVNMTALTNIWLGNNSLTGPIPDLSSLKMLETLHLEGNQFSGSIPSSLGDIKGLRELFLQNNNLTGTVPNNLKDKPGLNLRTSGNNFGSPPPS